MPFDGATQFGAQTNRLSSLHFCQSVRTSLGESDRIDLFMDSWISAWPPRQLISPPYLNAAYCICNLWRIYTSYYITRRAICKPQTIRHVGQAAWLDYINYSSGRKQKGEDGKLWVTFQFMRGSRSIRFTLGAEIIPLDLYDDGQLLAARALDAPPANNYHRNDYGQ